MADGEDDAMIDAPRDRSPTGRRLRPRGRPAGLAAAGWLSIAMTLMSPATAGIRAVAQEADPVARTEYFTFHDDLRVNLHHFLHNWAREEAGERPSWAPALREYEDGLGALTVDEREAWTNAVSIYARTVGRNLVFDDGLVAVRDALIGRTSGAPIPQNDRPLLDALDDALDVYRDHFRPSHEEMNRAWIERLLPVLRPVEAGIARRLENAYGGSWPEQPVRVDVVAYANDVGAYSTGGAVAIASADEDNDMPQAVELVFHEASHHDRLERPLRSLVSRAFRAERLEAPDRFRHDLIFYTTGEATRLEFERQGLGDYLHYGALGVYRRGARWPARLQAFAAAWRPFLESESSDVEDRERALRQVARALEAELPVLEPRGADPSSDRSCRDTTIAGRVEHGNAFETAIGAGLVFRLDPADPDRPQNPQGWTIRVTPADDPEADYSMVVTPPYRFSNRRYVDTGYGFTARETLAWTPRTFEFVGNHRDFEAAWDALGVLLWSGEHTDVEITRARATREALRTYAGELTILDGAVRGADREGSPGVIDWMSFRVALCVPE